MSEEVAVKTEEVAEETGENTSTMWEALADSKNNLETVVYYCDVSFPVGEDGTGVREVFAATSKEKSIARIYSILQHPDVVSGLDLSFSPDHTPLEAVQDFFEDEDERNLFLALVPVI